MHDAVPDICGSVWGVIAKAAGAYGSYVKSTYGLTIQKIWVDNDNAAGNRPDSITVSIPLATPGDAYKSIKVEEFELTGDDWTYELKADDYKFYPGSFDEYGPVLGYEEGTIRVTDEDGNPIDYNTDVSGVDEIFITITNKAEKNSDDPVTDPSDSASDGTELVAGMEMKNRILIYIGLLLAAALCLGGYNLWETRQAGIRSAEILQEMQGETEEAAETEPLPEYIRNPEMEMPETEIEGNLYIGTLEIPALDVEVPVMSTWSYPQLRIAPCRYQGSAYLDNLIICAHNYDVHFGGLKHLEPGDAVAFTDAEGNVFSYQVETTEILEPTDIEKMESGGWDLTLFTCTIGGEYRVTVRCEKTNKNMGKCRKITDMVLRYFF